MSPKEARHVLVEYCGLPMKWGWRWLQNSTWLWVGSSWNEKCPFSFSEEILSLVLVCLCNGDGVGVGIWCMPSTEALNFRWQVNSPSLPDHWEARLSCWRGYFLCVIFQGRVPPLKASQSCFLFLDFCNWFRLMSPSLQSTASAGRAGEAVSVSPSCVLSHGDQNTGTSSPKPICSSCPQMPPKPAISSLPGRILFPQWTQQAIFEFVLVTW